MQINLCDFCGGEMHKRDQAATLTIHEPGAPTDSSPLSMWFSTAPPAQAMAMCANCLGHLLPITARARAARVEAAKQTAGKQVDNETLRRMLADINAFSKPR